MEEFLKSVAPVIGAKNAFDLSRDAQLRAYRKIFSRIGISEKEVDIAIEAEMKKMASDINRMPPFPKH